MKTINYTAIFGVLAIFAFLGCMATSIFLGEYQKENESLKSKIQVLEADKLVLESKVKIMTIENTQLTARIDYDEIRKVIKSMNVRTRKDSVLVAASLLSLRLMDKANIRLIREDYERMLKDTIK